MWSRVIVASGFALLLAGGCAFSPSAEFIEALGKDQATVVVKINTIYGTVLYCRTNIMNGDVDCNGEGIKVKSQASTIGVPFFVVPDIKVGQPTVTQPTPR